MTGPRHRRSSLTAQRFPTFRGYQPAERARPPQHLRQRVRLGPGQRSGDPFSLPVPGQGHFPSAASGRVRVRLPDVSADRLNRRDACAAAPNHRVNPVIVEGGRRSDDRVSERSCGRR